MTEETKQSESLPAGVTMGLSGILSAILGLATAAAGAGWPGIVGLAAVGIAIPFGWNAVVNYLNGRADARDADRAGADAGDTAVNLTNQGTSVSHGLDVVGLADPPTDGFPQR